MVSPKSADGRVDQHSSFHRGPDAPESLRRAKNPKGLQAILVDSRRGIGEDEGPPSKGIKENVEPPAGRNSAASQAVILIRYHAAVHSRHTARRERKCAENVDGRVKDYVS